MRSSRPRPRSRALSVAALAFTLLVSAAPALHAQPASPAAAGDSDDEDAPPASPDPAVQAGETAALTETATADDAAPIAPGR